MNLTVRVLGLELLSVDISTEQQQDGSPGDCTAQPISFTSSPGDQRWDQCAELS